MGRQGNRWEFAKTLEFTELNLLLSTGHVSSTYVERLKGISLVVRSEVVTTPQPELPFSSLDTLMVDVDVVMFISVLKCGGNNFSTRNFHFHLFLLVVDFSPVMSVSVLKCWFASMYDLNLFVHIFRRMLAFSWNPKSNQTPPIRFEINNWSWLYRMI